MRRTRHWARLTAAVALAGACAALLVSPASALILFDIKAPAAESVVPAANPTITADVRSVTGPLTGDIRLAVDWTESNQDQVVVAGTKANGQNAQTVSFPVNLAFNGRYAALIEATEGNGSPERSLERVFFVAAPPAVPSGVKAGIGPGARPTVSWNRNPEPDIVGYRVQRPVAGKPPAVVATTKDTTFTDGAPGLGAGYQVVALRRGARPGEEVASAPSPVVTALGSGGAGRAGPPAPLGRVDQSKFQQLLNQARQQAAAAGQAPPAEDGGFDANLPYSESAASEEELGSDEQRRPGGPALPFVAGGLLVLDGFLLLRFIRAQVARSLPA